jgi:hypothetical protein
MSAKRVWVRVALAVVPVMSAVAFTGCGSSQPAYCADRTNLENSVKGLSSLNASSGVSAWQAQVKKIQGDASTLVSSAKSDFPSQTSAITSSVNALKTSVAALSPSPSAVEITTVTANAASVVSSVNSFKNASNSKCS